MKPNTMKIGIDTSCKKIIFSALFICWIPILNILSVVLAMTVITKLFKQPELESTCSITDKTSPLSISILVIAIATSVTIVYVYMKCV
jgi:Trk-type K+ transport system membrane component